jgi:hypothetical protein
MKVGRIAVAVAIAAVAATALTTGPLAAVSVARPGVKAEVGPDRFAPVDEETGEKADPYIFFALKGVKPGWMYRMVVEDSPNSSPSLPCNPALTTQWHKAFGSGEVAFPAEPVSSGTYFPFAGNQPCEGGYVIEVQERRSMGQRWSAVRAFAFTYPSFRFSYVPLTSS